MPLLVHLTTDAVARLARRSGIRGNYVEEDLPVGVFCFPVLPSFSLTYQWLRELKRGGARTLVGIHFRVPSSEMVWVGHYGENHVLLQADQAVGLIMELADPRGYQIILPRSVQAKEIHRIRAVPQVVGWRYQPDSHLRTPCRCFACLPRGSIKSRTIRGRDADALPGYAQIIRELKETDITDVDMICWHLYRIAMRTRRNADDLAFLEAHESEEVQKELAKTLARFRGRRATEILLTLCSRSSGAVRVAAAASLLQRSGPAAMAMLERFDDDAVRATLREYRTANEAPSTPDHGG